MSIHDASGPVAAIALILALLSMVLPRRAETSKRLAIPLLIVFVVALAYYLLGG